MAPPGRHLLIEADHIVLSHGAKEKQSEITHHPLSRSAAACYGPRVVGIILTGGLDDGTAGLAEIKRRGGIAVVQEAATTYSPSMPRSAVKNVDVDRILPLTEIPRLLSTLAATKGERRKAINEEPLEENSLE